MPLLRSLWTQPVARALASVFLVSLVVRVVLFICMLGQTDSAFLRAATPDVGAYFAASDHIMKFELGDPSLNSFGPGHPVYLALLRTLLGDNVYLMILFNLIVGSLGSLLLGLLTFRLTDNLRAAWIAGLIHALSPSAISLSLILLSDTLFFTLLVAGLLFFVQALLLGDRRWYLLSGVWFGLIPLVRSIGVFFPLVLPLVAWLILRQTQLNTFRPMGRRMVWPTLTVLISFALLWGYTLRPRTPEDPPISLPAYNGMIKLAAKIDTKVHGISWDSAWRKAMESVDSVETARGCGFKEAYMAAAKRRFRSYLVEQPLTSLQVLFRNAWSNANSEHILVGASLPRWSEAWFRYEKLMASHFLNYRHLLFALFGLVVLGIDRRWDVAGISVLIYAYFLATSAITLEWGNRTAFPSMIGWALPAACGLAWILARLRRGRTTD